MSWTRLAAVALGALLLVGGVAAAAPGNAPADAGENGENGEAGQAGPPGEIGPSGGLPGPVPDFVGDLLDRIAGGVNGLGEALPDITPGGSGGGQSPAS
jgi:hypothetical protein